MFVILGIIFPAPGDAAWGDEESEAESLIIAAVVFTNSDQSANYTTHSYFVD